jgi:hypothetical protein
MRNTSVDSLSPNARSNGIPHSVRLPKARIHVKVEGPERHIKFVDISTLQEFHRSWCDKSEAARTSVKSTPLASTRNHGNNTACESHHECHSRELHSKMPTETQET